MSSDWPDFRSTSAPNLTLLLFDSHFCPQVRPLQFKPTRSSTRRRHRRPQMSRGGAHIEPWRRPHRASLSCEGAHTELSECSSRVTAESERSPPSPHPHPLFPSLPLSLPPTHTRTSLNDCLPRPWMVQWFRRPDFRTWELC